MRQHNTKHLAFTLIEVLISIVLLGIIFSYLYSTINSMKKQNMPYLKKSAALHREIQIYKLLNLDISQVIGKVTVTNGDRYDMVSFETRNSIYDIIDPYVVYYVSKKENTFVRVESLKPFNFDKKEAVKNRFIYADLIAKECLSFKVSYKNEFMQILLRAKKLEPIVLKIPMITKR